MAAQQDNRARPGGVQLALLFATFFLIASGLGYPILNRFDPRQTPGLSDVKAYAVLVDQSSVPEAAHLRFRVLVPWVARPFYWIARGRVNTWDPVLFGLLVADSLFVAATATLIVVMGSAVMGSRTLRRPAVGFTGALLYLVNFAVPNLRLMGLVDAAEGFFLLALLWRLSEFKAGVRSWAWLLIAVLGTLTKESFVPFSIVMTSAWWLTTRSERDESKRRAVWILAFWVVSLATMIAVQWTIVGHYVSPLLFGLALHGGRDYLGHFVASLHDRNLWMIFLWLLPTALPKLRHLPQPWLVATAATCAMAFVLDAYFGGAPGTVGRALFSISGPVLSLSSGSFLLSLCGWNEEAA